MNKETETDMEHSPQAPAPAQGAKIVAQMPEDKEIQENLEELKNNDGFPGSCGI